MRSENEIGIFLPSQEEKKKNKNKPRDIVHFFLISYALQKKEAKKDFLSPP